MPSDRLAFDASDRFAHDRVVLVGGGADLQLAAIDDEPRPAAAEAACAAGFDLLLELLEIAESGIDRFREFARRLVRFAAFSEQLPEKRVVHMSAAVVAHRTADRFRHGGEIADQIFRGFC